MKVLNGAVRLDFFAPGASPASTGSRSRTYRVAPRQRMPVPWEHGGLTIGAVADDAIVTAPPAATLSTGPYLPRRDWAGAPDEDRLTGLMIAMTNAKEGREQEFDDWYWDQHFPDGMRLPGCFAARRYLRASEDASTYRHMAIYQFDIGDMAKVTEAHIQRAGTPELPISDSVSPVFQAWYLLPDGGWR